MSGQKFESWSIVELMGHVKMAGLLTEEERFGVKMGRIDIPTEDGKFVTQYFGGASVYRITACDENTGRAVARLGVPAPVHHWQLPAPVNNSENAARLSTATEADDDDYCEELYDHSDDSIPMENKNAAS